MTLQELKTALVAANAKWTEYEQEYILPCFELAEKSGIDLRKLVRDNPGKNCVILLVEELQKNYRPEDTENQR